MSNIDDNALCNVDDVKLYMDLRDSEGATDADDDLFEVLINQISKQIETYCNIVFKESTYVEYYDGKGSKELFVDHYPITTISGIWQDSAWDWADSTEISSDLYRSADNNKIILYNSTFAKYTQNIKIIYNAGYNIIPKDLVLVCIKEVSRLFRNRTTKGATFRREDTARGSMDSAFIVDEFLPENISVLNRYRIKGAL